MTSRVYLRRSLRCSCSPCCACELQRTNSCSFTMCMIPACNPVPDLALQGLPQEMLKHGRAQQHRTELQRQIAMRTRMRHLLSARRGRLRPAASWCGRSTACYLAVDALRMTERD